MVGGILCEDMMNIDTLRKAMQHQYPEQFTRLEIMLGYEEAWEQVTINGKVDYRSKGYPDNDPEHARIVVWPAGLPRPTPQEIATWAAAYDAEQPAKETAAQATSQRRQQARNAVKNFDADKVNTLAEMKALLVEIVELLKEE